MLYEGMPIVFGDSFCFIPYEKESFNYEIGGIICEYILNDPMDYIEIVYKAPYFKDKYTPEKLFDSLTWINDELMKRYYPSSVVMFSSFLLLEVKKIRQSDRKSILKEKEELETFFPGICDVEKRIVKDAGVEGIDYDRISGTLLSGVLKYLVFFGITKPIAEKALPFFGKETELDEKIIEDFPIELFTDYLEVQEIDYKVVSMEEGLMQVYTAKTPLSLLILEVSKMIEHETVLVKCKNCGNYFVPTGRNDVKYCGFKAPQNPEKTCKEVGAQLSRMRKEKEDIITREYRKKYMQYMMRIKRHPEDQKNKEAFARLKKDAKEMKKKYSNKEITKKELVKWIKEHK